MKITIEIPDQLQDSLRLHVGEDAAREVKEALAVSWYQAEKLSIGQVAELLGISVYEADGLMKRRNVDLLYSFDDFEQDRAVLERVLRPENTGSGPAQANGVT